MIQNFSNASDLDLGKYTEQEILAAWFRLAHQQGMAVALWRLPGQAEKHLVLDTAGGVSKGKIELEECGAGFLVAPFDNQDRSHETLLKAHIYYNLATGRIESAPHLSSAEFDELMDLLKTALLSDKKIPPFYLKGQKFENTFEADFLSAVKEAVSTIHRGALQKVVPAVTRKVTLTDEFNCLNTFDKLCASYPAAFISLVSSPGTGTWMGASPESIIEVDKSKIFTTVAVAGTQKYQADKPLQEVAWTQKEIEEQALVSRYIINCFKKIRLREFEELGPKTVVAGNLLHLKTTYTVDMEDTNFPLLGSVMLDLLHPTSAVCGMPKTPAQEFLKTHEKFQRELFSGYLGPVNINDETHLFVNLRCMQIQQKVAILYAGAGVTEDSVPEKEWVETQLKCDTLLDVLNQ